MELNPGEVVTKSLQTFCERFDEMADPNSPDGRFQVPERKYAHFGAVAFDCEQFVVNGVGVNVGPEPQPGGGFAQSPKQPVFTFLQIDAMLVREVPNLDEMEEPPTSGEMNDAALAVGMDLKALDDAWWDIFGRNPGSVLPGCQNVYHGEFAFVGPEGDLVATILTYYVQL